jgi:hypothetical protein
MLPVRIADIWRNLRLPGSTLAQDLSDASEAARNPRKTLLSCPWNHCSGYYFKARRVAWRVAFRMMRESRERPRITHRRAA